MTELQNIWVCGKCLDMSLTNTHCRECDQQLTEYLLGKSGLKDGYLTLTYVKRDKWVVEKP